MDNKDRDFRRTPALLYLLQTEYWHPVQLSLLFFKLKIEYFALFLAITLVLALIVNSSLEIRFCSPSRKCQGEILLFNDLFSKLNMLNV